MRISTIRRRGLGPPPECTPSAWAQGVFASFDHHLPGWRCRYDAEAIQLALVDLAGDDSPQQLNPVFLDALAEILAQIQAGRPKALAMVQEAVAEIASAPRLLGILVRLEIYFRPGFFLHDPIVREIRAGIVRDYAAILEPVILKFFNRCAKALDARERYKAKRQVGMTHPDLVRAPVVRALPAEVNEARAAAPRVLSQVEKELTPGAMSALRVFLVGRGRLNPCQAARTADVSEDTVYRALKSLGAIAERELGTDDQPLRVEFLDALSNLVAE